MRVLLASPYPLVPALHGGRARTAGLAAGLARAGAEVSVLCPWYPGQPRDGYLSERLRCQSHFFVSNALPALLRDRIAPAQVLLSWQPHTRVGLRRRLRRLGDFDIVQLDFCAHAPWIDLLPASTKVVYSAHNVERDYLAGRRTPYLWDRGSMKRMEQLERMAVRESDLVVTCTQDDGERLVGLYGGHGCFEVVPNGYDASLLGLDREALRQRSRSWLGYGPSDRVALFVGGDAEHNREAVRFMADRVLSRLGPNWRLLVVGRSGRRSPPDERVRTVGFAEDLQPYLAAADVAVNPVRHGSGSSVKLLTYLAARVPVLSTPDGARGLPAESEVAIADRDDFAAALEALPHLANGGSPVASLTWDRLGQSLHARYEELVGG